MRSVNVLGTVLFEPELLAGNGRVAGAREVFQFDTMKAIAIAHDQVDRPARAA